MSIGNTVFTKIGGISGALAIALGAYGAHNKKIQSDEHKEKVFMTASRYHLLHSVALLGVVNCTRPLLTGSLLCSGMLLFCGSLYSQALLNTDKIKRLGPFGGTLLIFGWLSVAL